MQQLNNKIMGEKKFNELVDVYLEAQRRIAVTKKYMSFSEEEKQAVKKHVKVGTYDALYSKVVSWANYLSK